MAMTQIIFYSFAAILLFSATMVVSARNPVRAALFLVLAFIASAGLWLQLQAEFLGLVLVLVYVGAVMTLFLFVVMMLNINASEQQQRFVFYLPLVALIVALVVMLMFKVIGPTSFPTSEFFAPGMRASDYSNVEAIGAVLYTDYLYPFEIAGVILLAAIVAAISLSFRGRRRDKTEQVAEQVRVKKADRLRIIK